MAIVTFKQATFGGGDIVVSFQYNDVNDRLTNLTVSNNGERSVRVIVDDGQGNSNDQENGTGFSLAPYGFVRYVEDELGGGPLPYLPLGVTYRIEVRGSVAAQGGQGQGGPRANV